jgi:uncharacterized membrane protein AbrB (regulator of aidB expression)
MRTRRTFVISIVLFILLVSSVTLGILIVSPVFAQENAIFSVSPGSFTASKVPPLGQPYTIPETIIVWNRDNVNRIIYITSEIPLENETTPGYAPIPNENWVRPFPSSLSAHENSYAQFKISINIPRQENLTGQKWEVWIPVERQPLPGEIGVLRPTVRMDIETTSELPPVSKGVTYYLALLILVILVIVAIVVVAWILSRSKGIKRKRALLRTD